MLFNRVGNASRMFRVGNAPRMFRVGNAPRSDASSTDRAGRCPLG
jgi:hypothetical protein